MLGALTSFTGGGGLGLENITGGPSADYQTAGAPISTGGVNVNIGDVLRPYNQGSIQNGGSPISFDRYMPQNQSSNIGTIPQSEGINYTLIAIIGIGLFLGYVIIKKG